MTRQTEIRYDDDLGGMAYPFLPAELKWAIVSRPLGNAGQMHAIYDAPPPTLRWVKDDKVLDLHVPGLDTETFLARSGLCLSMERGGYTLSKRLSRVMRPYRFWGFFDVAQVAIEHSSALDGRLWDGCGLVSRTFVERLAGRPELDERHRRELLRTRRFEVTCLHADGQEKGHVLVVDDLAVDFLFPAGSSKGELALAGNQVFIGLVPVHHSDEMCLDIQSLINLHPFFRPEQLLVWMELESALFLEGIASGRLAEVMGRLAGIASEEELAGLSNWHVGEYLASGGHPLWFAGVARSLARQHLNRLGRRERRLRCPAPGGRYYVFPAAVDGRDVPAGHVELEPETSTAWVNDGDWLDYLARVLGGCDGDDALWVLPFTDGDNERKVLAWRSPNQLGEYVLLKPTENSHTLRWAIPGGRHIATPKMNSRLLPPRIDSCHYQYGELKEADDRSFVSTEYAIAAMASTVSRAAANQGTLGSFCNVAMVTKALYGRLPERLPATLESVIDGSVKTGLDLTPVKAWTRKAAAAIVRQGKPVPASLAHRLLPLLGKKLQGELVTSDGHWLDALTAAMERHAAQYWADVEALATEAVPPLALFEHGRDWLPIGQELRAVYARVIREAAGGDEAATDAAQGLDGAVFAAARAASEAFLAQWPAGHRPCVLLGAAAFLYAEGPRNGAPVRDSVLWQLGEKRVRAGRAPGIAQQMLAALRGIGLLSEPVWTDEGAALCYREAPCSRSPGVPVTINGTWFNLLKATRPGTPQKMSQVPRTEREQAKARIAALAADGFVGMLLTTAVTDADRIITRTPRGNLFGYVQRDHELAAVRHDRW
ncbi:MAG: hypothetical protein GX579_16300, partial [Chloroflexi bacterium]|nr:hypothetical protein [Chloroflexota bacterium]